MIDEYIVNYADYIGIGSGSVSLVNGIFYVNTFSLDRYADMLKNDRLPIVLWRFLSEQEYLRYYLLTKLFGMKVDKGQFLSQFGADIHKKLGIELRLLKLAGAISEMTMKFWSSPGDAHGQHDDAEFFAALNTLRNSVSKSRLIAFRPQGWPNSCVSVTDPVCRCPESRRIVIQTCMNYSAFESTNRGIN